LISNAYKNSPFGKELAFQEFVDFLIHCANLKGAMGLKSKGKPILKKGQV